VVSCPIRSGQSVTVAAHDVMVYVVVAKTVDTVYTGAVETTGLEVT